jgi:hypothetical protein
MAIKTKAHRVDALATQIEAARAAADAFIDERAAALKEQHPSIPINVLRMQLTARGFGHCECAAALNILSDGK